MILSVKDGQTLFESKGGIIMKYGIITYTSAQNWGGILQSFALYYYLCKQGYDVELINYRAFDSRIYKPRKQIKDIIYSALKYKENKARIARYQKFRYEHLELKGESITSDGLKDLNSQYDAFITGSDQLWNCETKICYDFYLQFAEDKKLLLSYGPSFGQDVIPEQFKKEVTHLLNRYDMMSVRERSGSKIVEELTGKKIPVVCDPTFLLCKEEWIQVAADPVQEENYIFIYTTQVSQMVIDLVKKYLQFHPESKVVTPYAIPGVKAVVKKDIGPAEFLSYIQNADYVIGTSFHAVVFSLIFSRNFCVVPHSSTGARVNDLLATLGLEKNAIRNGVPQEFPVIDPRQYADKLSQYITASKKYIEKMMEMR